MLFSICLIYEQQHLTKGLTCLYNFPNNNLYLDINLFYNIIEVSKKQYILIVRTPNNQGKTIIVNGDKKQQVIT